MRSLVTSTVTFAVLAMTFIAPMFVASMLVAPMFIVSEASAEETGIITVQDANDMAERGELYIIDVRWPEEWEETGIALPAHAISMHLPEFLEQLDALIDNDRTSAIAIICAVGVRSAFMQSQLAALGFTNVVDVAEGMLGSDAGPGWLAAELPTRIYEP
jgi:rhodanese-related sulfurtransferase